MKIATLKFIGRQEGFGTVNSFDLYNIVRLSHPSQILAIGSTVTLATVVSAGFVAEFVQQPKPALALQIGL